MCGSHTGAALPALRRCSAKHREPPAPCHILTHRSWGRGKERGGRFCGLCQPWLFRGGPDLANKSSPNAGRHRCAAPWAPAPCPSSPRLGHPWRRFHPAGKPTRHKARQSLFRHFQRRFTYGRLYFTRQPGWQLLHCRAAAAEWLRAGSGCQLRVHLCARGGLKEPFMLSSGLGDNNGAAV